MNPNNTYNTNNTNNTKTWSVPANVIWTNDTNNIDYTTITVSGTSFDLFGAPQPLPKKVVFSLSQAIKNLEEEEKEEEEHG